MSVTNDPKAVELPLGSAQEFVDSLFDSVERAFMAQFGNRWSPDASQLYEVTRAECLRQAHLIDTGVAKPSAPISYPRVLTMWPAGRG